MWQPCVPMHRIRDAVLARVQRPAFRDGTPSHFDNASPSWNALTVFAGNAADDDIGHAPFLFRVDNFASPKSAILSGLSLRICRHSILSTTRATRTRRPGASCPVSQKGSIRLGLIRKSRSVAAFGLSRIPRWSTVYRYSRRPSTRLWL